MTVCATCRHWRPGYSAPTGTMVHGSYDAVLPIVVCNFRHGRTRFWTGRTAPVTWTSIPRRSLRREWWVRRFTARSPRDGPAIRARNTSWRWVDVLYSRGFQPVVRGPPGGPRATPEKLETRRILTINKNTGHINVAGTRYNVQNWKLPWRLLCYVWSLN